MGTFGAFLKRHRDSAMLSIIRKENLNVEFHGEIHKRCKIYLENGDIVQGVSFDITSAFFAAYRLFRKESK